MYGAGQIGDNTTTMRSSPIQIGTDINWNAIASGYNLSVAKKTTGTLWVWGSNSNGQLGDNSLANKSIPTQVGTASNWLNFTVGSNHVIARSSGVSFYNYINAWGDNQYGQLGNGTTINQSIPTIVNSCNPFVLGNENFEYSNDFSIYPNPATTVINIQNNANLTIDSIVIYDISGNKVIEEHKNCETINLEKLHAGTYLLKIYSKQKTVNIKFIKL